MTELGNMQTSQCGFEDSACGVPGEIHITNTFKRSVVRCGADVEG